MDACNDLSGAQYFHIFLRLRPSSPQSSVLQTRFLSTSPGHSHVYVTPPLGYSSRTVDKYTFSRVFDESCEQLDVFKETVLPLVSDVVHGRDGMLATLGVTGSGKVIVIGGRPITVLTSRSDPHHLG